MQLPGPDTTRAFPAAYYDLAPLSFGVDLKTSPTCIGKGLRLVMGEHSNSDSMKPRIRLMPSGSWTTPVRRPRQKRAQKGPDMRQGACNVVQTA